MPKVYNSFPMKFTNIDRKTLVNEAIGLYQAICQIALVIEDLKLKHLNDEYQ